VAINSRLDHSTIHSFRKGDLYRYWSATKSWHNRLAEGFQSLWTKAMKAFEKSTSIFRGKTK
jgi:hypothetical protein